MRKWPVILLSLLLAAGLALLDALPGLFRLETKK